MTLSVHAVDCALRRVFQDDPAMRGWTVAFDWDNRNQDLVLAVYRGLGMALEYQSTRIPAKRMQSAVGEVGKFFDELVGEVRMLHWLATRKGATWGVAGKWKKFGRRK